MTSFDDHEKQVEGEIFGKNEPAKVSVNVHHYFSTMQSRIGQ